MMAAAVRQTNDGITTAINQLAVISQGAADILRHLKAETFARPYLDLDAVASLAESARILRNLEDNAGTMLDVAWKLGDLEANATTLHSAAEKLSNLEANAGSLELAANQVNDAVRQVTMTSWNTPTLDIGIGTEELSRLIDTLKADAAPSSIGYNYDSPSDKTMRWLYFKWGLGIGAFIVIATAIAIIIMVHHTR
jgi:hypothetical protein